MKFRVLTIAALTTAIMFSAAHITFASGRGGGNCENCPMASITKEQRANIRLQLKELKDSGATREEIKAFKAEILSEHGVRMPEGRHNRGRRNKKDK